MFYLSIVNQVHEVGSCTGTLPSLQVGDTAKILHKSWLFINFNSLELTWTHPNVPYLASLQTAWIDATNNWKRKGDIN